MNGSKMWMAAAAATIAAALSVGSAFANRLPGALITGHVTAISGVESLNVDGHVYRIKAASAAAEAVRKLSPGQLVDVQLDGPTTTSASEVVNVMPHPGR